MGEQEKNEIRNYYKIVIELFVRQFGPGDYK
jgi:hypothetical protein